MIRILSLLFFLLNLAPAKGQQGTATLKQQAEQILKERGEVCFVFPRPMEKELRVLSHLLSIDRVDKDSVRAYANEQGFRYFLEVFDPNIPGTVPEDKIGEFVNDMIVRTLAGVTEAGRPLFLKMVYHGPKLMEELVNWDPTLIPGVLGGSAGTTYDAFKLISESQKHGAKVALFGRKINQSEHQLSFVRFLRLIVDGEITAEEAVPAYHGVLQGLGIKPFRSLEDDMQLTENIMSYSSSATTVDMGARRTQPVVPLGSTGVSTRLPSTNGEPDWARMSPEEKIAFNQRERDRIFG